MDPSEGTGLSRPTPDWRAGGRAGCSDCTAPLTATLLPRFSYLHIFYMCIFHAFH